MKSAIITTHLRNLTRFVLGVAMASSVAQASTNYFNLDSNPTGLVSVFQFGDNTTVQALAGAWISTNGSTLEPGVGNQATNGYISVTQTTPTNLFSAHGMRSAIVFGDLDPGLAPAEFSLACDLRIGAGNSTPADGISFNYVRNGDTAIAGSFPSTAYEKGAGTGLAVCLLAFPSDNLVTGLPGIQVKVDGVVLANVALTNINGTCGDATSVQTGPSTTNLLADLCWQPISISVNAAGLLNVSYKGTSMVSGLPVGSFGPGRFIIAGRTGGSWQEQDIDNLLITTTPATNPVVSAAVGNYYGWSFNIFNSGTQTVDPDSLVVTLDGTPVTPTSVTTSGSTISVSYVSGSAIFAGNSSHTLVASFSGSNFTGTITATRPFTVPVVNPTFGTFSSEPYGWKFNLTDIVTAGHILTPDTNTITVTMDGTPVTLTRIVQVGTTTNVTVVVYDSATPILATGSRHTNVVHFEGLDFPPVNVTNAYTIPVINGSVDRVHHVIGTFRGTVLPKLTANAGGHTGKPGDFGFDMGNPPSANAKFGATETEMLVGLRSAAASDVLSVSVWINRRTMNSSSDFWINSASAGNSGRIFQLHAPYADNNFYFDTAGATTQPGGRLQAASSSFAPYAATGNTTYWTSNVWHHFVAIKNGGAKEVWVDGQLFMSQSSGAFTMATVAQDINLLFVGGASPDNLPVNGTLDDFAVYSSALTPTEINSLFTGTAPDAINSNLLVWWDFNDGVAVDIKRDANNAGIINFSQMLQSATNVSGPYIDMPGITSPYTNSATNAPIFFRARKY